MKKITAVILSLLLCGCVDPVYASSASQKKPFPYGQGIALTKNVLYMNARELAAGAGLNTFWSDTFKDATQINSGSSSGYTARGASDYDVIINTAQPNANESMTGASAPSPLVATEDAGVSHPSWKMYDDDVSTTYWQATGSLPHWTILDLGSAKTVTSVSITTYDGANYPTAYKVEGSNTGSFAGEETILLNLSGQTDTGSFTKNFTTTGSYRYYKATFTGGAGSGEVLLKNFRYKLASPTQAVVRSVTTTLGASVSEVMVFADITLNTGDLDLVRVSANGGTNWKDVTNNLEEVVSLGHSGTSLILEVTFSGDAELEFWGVAA